MSDFIKGVQVGSEVKKYDYDALGNKPNLVEVDTTLSKSGNAADAKVVGNKFTEVEQSINQKVNAITTASANTLKGAASGAVVRVDDVSPVKHEVKVSVTVPVGVDPSTITVKRCGKNLVNVADLTVERTVAWGSEHIGHFELPSGKYTASLNFTQLENITYISLHARKYGVAEVEYASVSSNLPSGRIELTFEIPKGEYGVTLYVYTNCTTDVLNTKCLFSNIQVESGDIATDFEAYKEITEHITSSDGTVSELISVSPNMTILTDTDDVIVECEYNQDTNAVIKKLTDAIIALGGTV